MYSALRCAMAARRRVMIVLGAVICVLGPRHMDNVSIGQFQTDFSLEKKNTSFAIPCVNRHEPAVCNCSKSDTAKENDNRPNRTHWCILSKSTGTDTIRYFYHFPHASEHLLPCWSWFRRTGSTSNCGILLLDGLSLNATNPNSWQQQLVDAMGCTVREVNATMPVGGPPLSMLENSTVQHVLNRKLLFPRFGRQVYLDQAEDAQALRRLVGISDDFVKTKKGGDKPLQIGLIQRPAHRRITNLGQVEARLKEMLPWANITKTMFNLTSIRDQAQFFSTKDVIVAAHGAALTNSLFVTPGTIVMQVYPYKYFWQSLDPLIEQSGGIALDYYRGENPHVEWIESKARGGQNMRRDADIIVDANDLVDSILLALGVKIANTTNTKYFIS